MDLGINIVIKNCIRNEKIECKSNIWLYLESKGISNFTRNIDNVIDLYDMGTTLESKRNNLL
jgi:hypothetical protein